MSFVSEYLESYLAELGEAEAYARAQWAFLQERGLRPDPKEYGVTDAESQAIRVRLAQAS